jgi:hypothetical protein
MMRPEEVVALLRRRPFVPLRIHMTDGKIYDIHHPEMVLVRRQSLDIGVPNTDDGVADRVDHCSLLHTMRIEELASAG